MPSLWPILRSGSKPEEDPKTERMSKRLGISALLVLIGLALTVLLIVYLAFSAGPEAPASVRMDAMSQPGTVSWTHNGGMRVQASTFDDALILLGYGQARSRAWQSVLWRQAALGRLSEWFGPDALPVDRMIMQLGIPSTAEAIWDDPTAVDPETRQRLIKFVSGMDLALTSDDLNRASPFLLLGIRAESWQPWHSLALERLVSWISSPSSALGDDVPEEWAAANAMLRRLLRLHGAGLNTVAGAANDSLRYASARYATGSSGIPFFVETELDYGSGRFLGLTVPGTPVALIGSTHADAWALLGHSPISMRPMTLQTGMVSTDHHRIVWNGREEVVQSHRLGQELLLDELPRIGDAATGRLLSWTGLTESTDIAMWFEALAGHHPSPTLLAHDGVRWDGAQWTVTGNPSTVLRQGSGLLFATNAPEHMSPLETIRQLEGPIPADEWLQVTVSRAAEASAPSLLSQLPDSILTGPMQLEALRYLQNWNYEYDASETGASIFESILFEMSISGDSVVENALRETVRKLAVRYGPDMSSWRWESVQERTVGFPGAIEEAADGGRPEERFRQKYESVNLRSPGHPQTLVWGVPTSIEQMRVTSAWEGAVGLRDSQLLFRRPAVDFDRFLGTFLTGDRPPDLQLLEGSSMNESTTLFPRD